MSVFVEIDNGSSGQKSPDKSKAELFYCLKQSGIVRLGGQRIVKV